MKKFKNTKGVTLIALVITIIILLILAGITISTLAGENGLFKRARDAKNNTLQAQEEEQAMLNELNDYMNSQIGDTNLYEGIQIGDYVDYVPTSSSYTALAAKTGYTTDQPFSTFANTKWQVMDITGSTITLISEKPIGPDWTGGEGSDGTELYLKGAKGYNNAEDILNEMCQTLYSKSGVGTARSVNWNDVQKLTKWGNLTREQKIQYWIDEWGYTAEDFTRINSVKYKPDPENTNGYTDVGGPFTFSNTWDDFETNWLTTANGFIYSSTKPIDFLFGNPQKWQYWLASRAVGAGSYGYVSFEVGRVNWGYANSGGWCLFDSFASGYNEHEDGYAVRPAVSLKSSIQIDKQAGTRENPHQIK